MTTSSLVLWYHTLVSSLEFMYTKALPTDVLRYPLRMMLSPLRMLWIPFTAPGTNILLWQLGHNIILLKGFSELPGIFLGTIW